MALEFYLFGNAQVRFADGIEKTPTNTRKSSLLLYLACEPGLHRREALAKRFWCDASNEAARASLRAAIRGLHQEYAPYFSAVEDLAGFTQNADVWVDARAFRQGLVLAERADDPAPILARALALYRGEFLTGFSVRGGDPNEEWQRGQAAALHHLAVDGYLWLLRLHLANDETRKGLAAAERLARIDPYNDEGHLLHMRLLVRAGQARAAEQLYEQHTLTRQRELGASGPEPEMKALYDSLRRRPVRSTTVSAPKALPADEKFHRVPSPPYLVGRQTELAQITQLLLHPANRLVTLVGLGGAGKTWLAMNVAHRLEAAFANGAAFAPLAESNSLAGDAVASAIATALDITFAGTAAPAAQLAAYLRTREVLLVLDNFEHALPACELVEQLLAAAPHLKILVTSQVALNTRSEARFPVGGLFLPPLWNADAESIANSDAVRFFIAQAGRLRAGIKYSSESIAEIAAICEVAGGLPLAIQQAASWLGHLTLAEIRLILARRPAELPPIRHDLPPRQQSVGAAFEYSWGLLTAEQRRLLAQASVFPGPFDRAALRAVTGASLEAMAELTDRSLLLMVDEGRYLMHGLWRQMAGEKLLTAFEPELAETAAQRHAEYYMRVVADLGERLLGDESADIRRILRECALSIEQAAGWAVLRGPAQLILPAAAVWQEFLALEAQTEAGIAILTQMLAAWSTRADVSDKDAALVEATFASGLARFLMLRSRNQEAAERSARVARWSQQAEPSPAAFRALRDLVWASIDLGGEGAKTLLDRLRGMADTLQDRRGLAESRLAQALWETRQGDPAAASELLLEALAGFDALGWSVRSADCHTRLGQLYAARLAQPERARGYLERALALCKRLRLPYREIVVQQTLGIVAYSEGDYTAARKRFITVIERYQEFDLPVQVVRARIQLGVTTVELGVPEDAALHEEALALGKQAAEVATGLGNTSLAAYAHYVIGATYHSLGLLALARDAFETGVALARQVDAGEVLEILLGPLIVTLLDMGELAEADRIGTELIERMRGAAEGTRFGYAYCGYLFAEKGDLEQAVRCLSATPGMNDANPRSQPWFAQAMLAEVRLRQGDGRAALALVDGMLKHVGQRLLHATLYPARAYLACCRVLRNQNDPRAAVVLAAAQRWLRESVARLPNPTWRAAFIEGIPARRELLALRCATPEDLHGFTLRDAFSF